MLVLMQLFVEGLLGTDTVMHVVAAILNFSDVVALFIEPRGLVYGAIFIDQEMCALAVSSFRGGIVSVKGLPSSRGVSLVNDYRMNDMEWAVGYARLGLPEDS